MGEFKNTFMCTAIQRGATSDFIAVYSQFNETNDQESRDILSKAMSCAIDRSILEIYLHKIKECSNSEIVAALKYLSQNSNGYDMAWQTLKSEWKTLYQK